MTAPTGPVGRMVMAPVWTTNALGRLIDVARQQLRDKNGATPEVPKFDRILSKDNLKVIDPYEL